MSPGGNADSTLPPQPVAAADLSVTGVSVVSPALDAFIRERMARCPDSDFATFAAQNPDLLTWKPSILDRYYRPETLASDLARSVFLLPDRGLDSDGQIA